MKPRLELDLVQTDIILHSYWIIFDCGYCTSEYYTDRCNCWYILKMRLSSYANQKKDDDLRHSRWVITAESTVTPGGWGWGGNLCHWITIGGGGGWHRGAHIPYPRFFTPQYPISQFFLPPISHIPDFLALISHIPDFFTPQYPISQMCVTPPPPHYREVPLEPTNQTHPSTCTYTS